MRPEVRHPAGGVTLRLWTSEASGANWRAPDANGKPRPEDKLKIKIPRPRITRGKE